MIHLPIFISDLGVILITAAAVTLLFKFLKQPVVLGYLIAGFLVGKHVTFLPNVNDTENVKVWGEIGVIILLFSLGLEFNLKKISVIGKSAFSAALFEVIFMISGGYLAGLFFGWNTLDSLFLGGISAISSTSIIVRTLDELGFRSKRFVELVFGLLVFEDLVAILLLVILSTVGITQKFEGTELIQSVGKLGFFLVLWFTVGIYLVPSIFKKIEEKLNDETMLVVSLGMCLGMVTLSTHAGYSPALGAFIMGSIISGTQQGKRIEHLIVPIKDLFAAIFFVSVGMLINPEAILNNWQIVIVISLIIIFGKLIGVTLGSVISGQDLKKSIQAGLCLGQVGEISFVIATLGMSLKVINPILYPIAVAVSVLTTFTTPYFIRSSDKIYELIENRIPQKILIELDNYSARMGTMRSDNFFYFLIEKLGMKIFLNSVIIIAISFYMAKFNTWWAVWLTFILVAPFMWAIIFGPAKKSEKFSKDHHKLAERFFVMIMIVRIIIAIILILIIFAQFSSTLAFSGLLFIPILIILLIGTSQSKNFYERIETRFLNNFETNDQAHKKVSNDLTGLIPWDAMLVDVIISPNSNLILKTLIELKIRERFGLTVAIIERGSQKIFSPGRDEILLPMDKLHLIGSEEQIEIFKRSLNSENKNTFNDDSINFGLESIELNKESDLVGKSIRDSGMRDLVNGLIVGIERDSVRILNPGPETVLMSGDMIWIVGERTKIKSLIT